MAFKMKKPLFNGTNQHKKELKNTPLKEKEKSTIDKISSIQKKGKYAKYAAQFAATSSGATGTTATAILGHPLMKVLKAGVGETATVALLFAKHTQLQRDYKKMYPDSKYSWYNEDPRFKAGWQGGEGLDQYTGLPTMNVAEKWVLTGDKTSEGGGWFGMGDVVFPGAAESYKGKLDAALEAKSITKEQHSEAIKKFVF